MQQVHRLYLDTNVFILLVEGDEGEERRQLLNLMMAPRARAEPFFCTSALSLAELLVRPLRQRNRDLVRLYEKWISQDSEWLEVGAVTRPVLVDAARIRSDHTPVKLPDAIHLATAITLRCSHVLSNDMKLPETVRLKEQDRGAEARPIELVTLRATPETLSAIARQQP